MAISANWRQALAFFVASVREQTVIRGAEQKEAAAPTRASPNVTAGEVPRGPYCWIAISGAVPAPITLQLHLCAFMWRYPVLSVLESVRMTVWTAGGTSELDTRRANARFSILGTGGELVDVRQVFRERERSSRGTALPSVSIENCFGSTQLSAGQKLKIGISRGNKVDWSSDAYIKFAYVWSLLAGTLKSRWR